MAVNAGETAALGSWNRALAEQLNPRATAERGEIADSAPTRLEVPSGKPSAGTASPQTLSQAMLEAACPTDTPALTARPRGCGTRSRSEELPARAGQKPEVEGGSCTWKTNKPKRHLDAQIRRE